MNVNARSSLLVLTAGLLWGTIGVVGKAVYSAGQISPLTVALLRLAIAAPLLGLLSLRLDRGTPPRKQRRDLAWWALAMLSMAGYQIFIFGAVQRTTVTSAIFLAICTAPVLVALVEPFLLRAEHSVRTLVAGALALAGTVLVLGLGNAGDLLHADYFLGNMLALGAALCWATYVLVARRLIHSYTSTRITFFTFIGASLILVAPVVFQFRPANLSSTGWLLIIYLGVVPTAIAYSLLVRGLRHVTATTAAFLALAEPGTAAILAALFFDERLAAVGWLGVGLLLGGLVLLSLNRVTGNHHRKPSPSSEKSIRS